MIQGISEAPQAISFPAMAATAAATRAHHPARIPRSKVLSSFIGVDGTNTTLNSGRILINLKPLEQRKINATDVIRRLQPQLAKVDGITLYMQPVQDLTVEDRVSRTQYQYTLEDPDAQRTEHLDRETDGQAASLAGTARRRHRSADSGLCRVAGDRPRDRFAHGNHAADDRRDAVRCFRAAASLDTVHTVKPIPRHSRNAAGVPERPGQTERHLCAFGHRAFRVDDRILGRTHGNARFGRLATATSSPLPRRSRGGSGSATPAAVSSINGGAVPLSTFTHFEIASAPLSVNHQGQFPVVTISFNLAPGRVSGRRQRKRLTRRRRKLECR